MFRNVEGVSGGEASAEHLDSGIDLQSPLSSRSGI